MTLPKDPIKAEEYRRKISEAAKKRVCSDDLRKRRSEMMAERNRSQKHRDQVSKAHKGRKLSEWQIELLRKANTGRVDSEETKRRRSESHKGEKNIWYGKKLPEEARRKMSEVKKGITGDRHPRWIDGRSFEPYCELFNEDLKERVREFFGRICILCGITENEHARKLSVHHVYTEKMSCCESKIEEMDELRERFPEGVAKFGSDTFTSEEITKIRMMVPLCIKCHNGKAHGKNEEHYRKMLDDTITEIFGGKCYFTVEEYANKKLI